MIKTNNNGPIFLLDDEPLCLEATQALLQTFGFECIAFASSEELLDSLPDHAAGLALVDYRLSDQNGLEVFHSLRANGHDLPVVLISGHAEQHTRTTALDAGVARFLLKPIGPNELCDTLRRILETN
jgi:two-component system response regulator FixJ